MYYIFLLPLVTTHVQLHPLAQVSLNTEPNTRAAIGWDFAKYSEADEMDLPSVHHSLHPNVMNLVTLSIQHRLRVNSPAKLTADNTTKCSSPLKIPIL